MGAFDTYEAVVRCPNCAELHWIDGQTKFFDPDYDDQVSFHPGVACPIGVDASELAVPLWNFEWMRVREPGPPDRLDLLVDFDELVACECGLACAIILRFAFTPGIATLTEIQLLDARRPDLASHIDFVNVVTYGPLPGLDRAGREALAAGPLADRTDHVARCIAARFDHDPDDDSGLGSWTHVVGPTRCEACGQVRERTDMTLLTHPSADSFFGPGWTGGPIFLGTAIPFDDGWLADDVDRGQLFRVRHPIGSDRIVILGQPTRSGCACGAGPATFVRHFVRRPGELELAELTIRVIEDRDDLADIDFIEGQTRLEYGTVVTREHVITNVLARHAR